MNQLFSVFCLFTFFISFVFGFFVYKKNKKSLLNRYWLGVSFFVGLWSLSLFAVVNARSSNSALAWQYLLDVSAILIPSFFLSFTLVLVDKYHIKKISFYLSWLSCLFLIILSFTDFFKLGVLPLMDFNYWIVPGSLYFIFPLFYGLHVIYIVYLLILAYKKSVGLKRGQIKYVLLTAIIGFSGGPTNFLPQLFNIYPFGNFLVVFYVVGIAYAITRYRLMDIKLVLRKYSVYLASLTSLIIPAFILKYLLSSFASISAIWIDLAILASAVSTFPALKGHYYKFANKYLFSSLYDSKTVIADLSNKLSSTLDIGRIYKDVSDVIMGSIRVKSLCFLIYESGSNEYEAVYNRGFKSGGKKFKSDKGLYEVFIKKNKPIIVDELKFMGFRLNKKFLKIFNEFEVGVIVPLNLKDKSLGLIALGNKESGDIINEEDLNTLNIIGSQAALAINNALSYEEIRDFNAKLERRVREATADLREANQKLMKLDETKSEFISIASHQLRTPLTIIKGYISMILEKNFGEINEAQEEALTKVYQSNERLIQLVENLLNISRIESGRFQYTFERLSIKVLTESAVKELSSMVEKNGLTLKYKAEKNLPEIYFDEEKLRQVILNLIDNALKYSKKGTVLVEIKKAGNNILFTVSDKGIGISSEDMPNLFKKFSRGSGTSLVHTGGTGLGLYVAKNIIEAHGGKIWAESRGSGKGAVFSFCLPIDRKI
jgi:signal transduction histidine kinase